MLPLVCRTQTLSSRGRVEDSLWTSRPHVTWRGRRHSYPYPPPPQDSRRRCRRSGTGWQGEHWGYYCTLWDYWVSSGFLTVITFWCLRNKISEIHTLVYTLTKVHKLSNSPISSDNWCCKTIKCVICLGGVRSVRPDQLLRGQTLVSVKIQTDTQCHNSWQHNQGLWLVNGQQCWPLIGWQLHEIIRKQEITPSSQDTGIKALWFDLF